MFVLAIDPGLAATGYAVVREESGVTSAVAAGVIKTDSSRPIANRLAELYEDLTALIDEHRPDEAAVEEVFTNRNLQTAIAVGRASGAVLLAAAQAGLPIYEYSPTAVKAAVCGYGGAPKDQVQRMVSLRLGLDDTAAPDAADALALALCHLQSSPLRRATEHAS